MAISQLFIKRIRGIQGNPGTTGDTGRDGFDGRKINFCGEWTAGNEYYFNNEKVDVVSVGGRFFYCRRSNSRTAPPALDTAYWGKFRNGSKRYVATYEIAVADWTATGAEEGAAIYEARKATDITADKFLQEKMSPTVKATYGILLGGIDNGDVIFYAKTLPAAAVTISLWYYDIDGTVIEGITRDDEKPTIFQVFLDEDSGKTTNVYYHTGLVDWGDGIVDEGFFGEHTYENYGSYTMRMKGAIAADGSYLDGAFGYNGHPNETIKSAFFQNNELGDAGLAYCDELESVVLSGKETSIPDLAFRGSGKLASIELHDGILSIGNMAFDGTGIRTIGLPGSLLEIGLYAFRGSRLISLTIPNRVSIIPSWMCSACLYLASVYLPHGITEIGMEAFTGLPDGANIHYDGTIAEWEAINKSYHWTTSNVNVICTDGYAERA